nr:potassium-transporting ATPase subunit C [Mycobacterium sp.]
MSSLLLTVVVAIVVGIAYPLSLYGIGQVAFKSKADGSLVSRGGQPVGSTLLGQNFTDNNGNALAQYFQPRPSSAGTSGYDASASGASNLGPGDPRLVGFIPGFNSVGLDGASTATNPFGTPADPYCVPTDTSGNPVTSPRSGQQYAKDSDGHYSCYSGTIPQRAIAYRSLNNLPADAAVPVDAVTGSGSGLDPQISVANAQLQAPRVAQARHLLLRDVTEMIAGNTTDRYWGFLGEKGVNVLALNLALDGRQGRP